MVMDTRHIPYSTVDEKRRKPTKTDENRRIVGADKMLSFMNKLRELFQSRRFQVGGGWIRVRTHNFFLGQDRRRMNFAITIKIKCL